MPPARPSRPRRPQRQTTKCRFLDQSGIRCTRIATVEGALCRQHAVALEQQLERGPGGLVQGILGAMDRAVATRLRADPLTRPYAAEVSGMLRQIFTPRPQAPRPVMPGQAGTPPRARVYPPQPRPAPGPSPEELKLRDALLRLGFEDLTGLTAARIKDRKRQLAKLYHPDTGTGDEAAMKRVMDAADVLTRHLAAR